MRLSESLKMRFCRWSVCLHCVCVHTGGGGIVVIRLIHNRCVWQEVPLVTFAKLSLKQKQRGTVGF